MTPTHDIDLYARPTAVYRLYDSEDRLLYVGVAWDLEIRWTKHRLSKEWWPQVANRHVVWHANRFLALAEEDAAIELEGPLYNVVGTPEMSAIRRRRPRFATGQPANPDRHRDAAILVRPTVQLRDQARAILEANGWTMNDFLIACLVLLTKNPSAMLNRLKEFRPPEKKGRPRKKP